MAAYFSMLSFIFNCKICFKKKILFIDVVEHFDNFYHTIGTQVENLSLPYVKYINEDNNIEDVNKYIENVKQNKKYKRSDHLRLKKFTKIIMH